jgi:hypothetical protein
MVTVSEKLKKIKYKVDPFLIGRVELDLARCSRFPWRRIDAASLPA